MQSGRLYNKLITATNGTNLTNSSTQAYKHVEIDNIPTTTSSNLQYGGEDDSQKVLSGAGGDGGAGSPEKAPQRWGYVAPSGSRFEVNDTAGAERIDIVHKSGAGVVIDPDGAIYVVSKSSRGAGLSAPFGDVFITAAGDIVIKGHGSITIQTEGDLNLDVGGALNATCDSYNLITKNYNTTVDGAATTNVTNDNSTIVGGIDRRTIAGDQREQTSGQRITDVGGNMTTRIGGDNAFDVGGKFTESTGGNKSTSVGGDHSIGVSGTSNISSSGDSTIYSGGTSFYTSGGTANVKAGGPVKLTGSAVNASPAVDLALWSDETEQAAKATILGGLVGAKPPQQAAASGSAASVEGPKDAQVMEANDIVDTLTSARKYPEYPGNGVLESANGTGYSMIEYDQTPQAEDVFNEYSGGNQGNINPSQSMDSFDMLPDTPVNRDPNITAQQSDTPIPSRGNTGAKISKYFTLGQLINAKHSHKIPPTSYDSVVQNHILAATNVLDPIKEKFPDLIITSAYRGNSSNHRSGKAIDMVVESRSMTKHAEIARFARDNLPVDQVFIEKNTSGRTHVHIRVSSAGSKATPTVLTCGDPRCRSKVPGIQVDWLARRAK